MTCVLTDREGRGYEWSSRCDEQSIKSFVSQRHISKLIFAACVEGKCDALDRVFKYATAHGIDCKVNRLFCIEGGPSLFGEGHHSSEGNITPIFAAVMGVLRMQEEEAENPQITRCVELLLEHSANPYVVCKVSENCFPIEISSFDLDVRGLLRLCRMFLVGSTRTAEEVEVLLDTFEMRMGLQDLERKDVEIG